MPATVENSITAELSPTRRDSTFSYDPSPVGSPIRQSTEMDRLRGTGRSSASSSTEHTRTESVRGASPLLFQTPGIRASTRRVRAAAYDFQMMHN